MVSKEALSKIRNDVESYVGQEIFVKANVGRNKCIYRRGVIDSIYPNLFVFKENEEAIEFLKEMENSEDAILIKASNSLNFSQITDAIC